MKPLHVNSNIQATQASIVTTQKQHAAAALDTQEGCCVAPDSFMPAVNQGLEDVAAGRVLDDDDLIDVLDREFGAL